MTYDLMLALRLFAPMRSNELFQGPAAAVFRLPAKLLPRPVGLHQHFLADRVDPGELGWSLGQLCDHLGGGIDRQFGDRNRVPAEGIGEVARLQGAAAREVVGARRT